MVIINNSTPDDDLRSDKDKKEKKTGRDFIKRFNNLPPSQMYYKPLRILKLDDTEVLLEGVEGLTNMKINVKLLRSMFDKMIQNNTKARFLVDDWNEYNITKIVGEYYNE